MRKARLPLVVMLALVLSLGLTASSWARPLGCGPGGMNLTPEQAGQVFDLKEKFHSDTASLRKEMWIKRTELTALWRAETPDQNQIRAKQKELNAVRDQLQEKAVAFRLQVRKIMPQAGLGMGMGPGMGGGPGCGMGMAMGPGDGAGPGF